jgi:multisubunit Na+/H+ antiporter MnhC subunit
MIAYMLCLVLFCLGVYGALAKRNIIKIILGIAIAECAVNLMFVLTAYRTHGSAPILPPGPTGETPVMVDPLPHALVLTAIVIGLATMALMVALAMRIYQKYGTYDISEIRELRG